MKGHSAAIATVTDRATIRTAKKDFIMNTRTAAVALSLLLASTSYSCLAADSMGNAGTASKQSGQALKHGALASGQVVSATVAVPLVVVGEMGKVAGKAGEGLMEFAIDQPLEVSDTTITADPAPALVMAPATNSPL